MHVFISQKLLQQEKQNNEHSNSVMRKLLDQCELLRNRLQECNFNLVDEDKLIMDSKSSAAACDLQAYDNRISHLLSEVI